MTFRGLALSAACLLGITVGGCGAHTVVETVTSGPPTSSSAGGSAANTAGSGSTSQPQLATVGDTLTLQGSGGESLAVTVDQVMDPLPVGSDDQADGGQRFVGVQITLRNVGSVPYSDSPSNGATLLSNTNEQAQREIVTGGPCGNDFASSVNISPGDTEQGCVPFEMPTGQTSNAFQFTLDSGFANQTGQWSLTQGAPTPGHNSTSPSTSSARASGPLAIVNSYWNSIGSHQFATAYAYLAPAAVSQTESQFVSDEQQTGIQSVTFSGHVASSSGSSATVDVDSLITHDKQFGCRTWTGSYQLSDQTGNWLIEEATITAGSC